MNLFDETDLVTYCNDVGEGILTECDNDDSDVSSGMYTIIYYLIKYIIF